MKKIQWKGSALLAPIPPVMVTCGTISSPNVLTIAWTGILNTVPPKTYISVRPERYSYNLIKESGEFVINLTTRELVWAADFCGVKSGSNTNKLKEMKLEVQNASVISAPILEKSPVNIECRVTDIIKMGSHDMFIADIVSINIAEQYIDEKGKLNLDKCDLVAYSHGEYFALGEKLGSFGYSVRKKPINRNAKKVKK